MADQFYAIYDSESGDLFSVSSTLADPMPAHLTVLPIDEIVDFSRHRWNKVLKLIEDYTPPVPPIIPLASDEIMAIPEIVALSPIIKGKIRLAVRKVVP